jgi:hypothetical protein
LGVPAFVAPELAEAPAEFEGDVDEEGKDDDDEEET